MKKFPLPLLVLALLALNLFLTAPAFAQEEGKLRKSPDSRADLENPGADPRFAIRLQPFD